jgi:hypothetical protein
MSSEIIPYAVAGCLVGILLMALICCLLFRAVEHKRDITSEILEGLREPMWKTTTTAKKPEVSYE